MSFYYLFIPTWFLTVILYTLMAKKSGATEDYTEEIKEEEKLQLDIKIYQEEKAKTEKVQHKDNTFFSKVLNTLSVIFLIVILALATYTMFGSANMEAYNINKDIFHKYAFLCTIGYFVFAYWSLLRKKAFLK